MLRRLYRFHGYGSLNKVYRSGATLRGGSLSLKYGGRKPGTGYRVAVVVSKKVHKSAVVRNRIRRRIFEAIRHYAQDQTLASDLVFTVFDDRVAAMPSDQLTADVARLLEKAH
ncbi:MAG: putative Ribonuclease [Candidatus Saccharibacteria bacterium]|nr:putative Ribonuclease [Candidatus Saccharibacteria bacterium]